MRYTVHMLAYKQKGVTRIVDISEAVENLDPNIQEPLDEDATLELIFKYGQNEFQQVNPSRYSVSVGDVIEMDGKFFVVAGFGFFEISQESFDKLEGNTALPAHFVYNEKEFMDRVENG